jgi:CheY-like chemotaxis protein
MAAVDLVAGAGFDAVEAKNAGQAVRILDSRLHIRIVFTDIDMPGSMNGLKLAAAIRGRWSWIEIIVVSGHVKPPLYDLPGRAVFFEVAVLYTEYLSVTGHSTPGGSQHHHHDDGRFSLWIAQQAGAAQTPVLRSTWLPPLAGRASMSLRRSRNT